MTSDTIDDPKNLPVEETSDHEHDPQRRNWRSVALEWTGVGAFFTLLGAVLTWPLVTKMSSGFYGFGNDNWGGIWFFQWINKAFWGPESIAYSPDIEYPFGFEFDDRFIQPYDRLLSIVFGGIAHGLFVYNLMMLLSFTFGGMAAYALAKYLTGNRRAAILAGVIFVAAPLHLAMTMQYPAMASMFSAPLVALALVHLLRTRSLKAAAWLGAALALAWATSYYYGWFAVWFLIAALVTVACVELFKAARARRFVAGIKSGTRFAITRGSVAAGTFVAISLPLLLPLITQVANDQEKFARAPTDLPFTAVRPWQYILPPHDNPFIGWIGRDQIYRHMGILPVYEQSLYLGLVAVLLAVLALVFHRRTSPAMRAAFVPLLAGAAFCALLSLGPSLPLKFWSVDHWITPSQHPHITGPVQYVYDISPNFRYYGRADIFVCVALAAFAAAGYVLLEKWMIKRAGVRSAIPLVLILSFLVLIEYANRPPERFVHLDTNQPWMQAVKELPPDATIIEYPAAGYSTPRSLQYTFWQPWHGRRTVNPPESIESQAFMRMVEDPNSFFAGRTLSKAGVQYAVIHTKLDSPTYPPYQPAMASDQLPRWFGSKNLWFEHYRSTPDSVIYKVRKRPRSDRYTEFGFGKGWYPVENDGTGAWRWMQYSSSDMFIYSGTDRGKATLSMRLTSFIRPRTVRISVGGNEVKVVKIPGDKIKNLTIPIDVKRGVTPVRISATPGAIMVDKELHNTDKRTLAVRLDQPRIEFPDGSDH